MARVADKIVRPSGTGKHAVIRSAGWSDIFARAGATLATTVIVAATLAGAVLQLAR